MNNPISGDDPRAEVMILQQRELQPVDTLGGTQLLRDFEVVLHVGYPKTASTWLQETIFADPDSGFVFPWYRSDCRARTISAFVTVNSYSDDSVWARTFFEEGLRRCAGGSGVPIISDESLCGDPLLRFYTGRYIADRIHSVFPRAKILIGVREQKAIAISLYREYLLTAGSFPLEVFLGRGDEPMGYSPILRPDYLEYDRVVGYYQKLYGRENVLVLPMELLQKEPQKFVESIFEFCQCSGRIEHLSAARRVGLSAVALEIQRWLNPLIPVNPLVPQPSTIAARIISRLSHGIDRLVPRSWSTPLERRWKTITARRYDGMFRDSNRRLAELTGIDLAALGYEC